MVGSHCQEGGALLDPDQERVNGSLASESASMFSQAIFRVHIRERGLKHYTTGLMTKRSVYVNLNTAKKDYWSGKERLCCRYIQTALKMHIACLIFRGQLCRPPKTRNGLFVHALIRPDQVDIWGQEFLSEPRDNQIIMQ